MEVPVHR